MPGLTRHLASWLLFFPHIVKQLWGRCTPARRPERQNRGKRWDRFKVLNDKLRFTKDFGALCEGAGSAMFFAETEGELTLGSPAAFAAGSVWRGNRAKQSNTPSVSRQKTGGRHLPRRGRLQMQNQKLNRYLPLSPLEDKSLFIFSPLKDKPLFTYFPIRRKSAFRSASC